MHNEGEYHSDGSVPSSLKTDSKKKAMRDYAIKSEYQAKRANEAEKIIDENIKNISTTLGTTEMGRRDMSSFIDAVDAGPMQDKALQDLVTIDRHMDEQTQALIDSYESKETAARLANKLLRGQKMKRSN